MGAQDGAEGAELHPARKELRIDRARHVAADVVAPVGIAHVGRGGRKPGLKGQRRPLRNGVAGEADLVAVIAEPAPAMEQQRPLALALLVGEVNVVEPPGRAHAGHLRVRFLLPVEPPEIDALLLQRMQDQVHVVGGEFLVGEVEGDVLPAGGIDAHGPRHLGIMLFPRLNARCRMQVQAGLQVVGVQPGQELIGIGKEQLVPACSRSNPGGGPTGPFRRAPRVARS